MSLPFFISLLWYSRLDFENSTNSNNLSHSADYNLPNHQQNWQNNRPSAASTLFALLIVFHYSLRNPICQCLTVILQNQPLLVTLVPDISQFQKHRYRSSITQYIQITFTHRPAKTTVWLMLVIFPIKGTVQVIGQPPTLRTFRSVIKNTSVCCPLLRLST